MQHQLNAVDIIYLDDHIVAVNKPAGLMVHRGRGVVRGTRFALQMVRNAIGRRLYPVHRLDRPTSGVLLFGLHPEAAQRFAKMFRSQALEKCYIAVVRGYTDQFGRIEHPLARDPKLKVPVTQRLPAVTLFRRLACVELPYPVRPYATSRYTLLEVRPLTGRMHQIRRHLRSTAHPVVGDRTYGDPRHNEAIAKRFNCPRMLLSSVSVAFQHPFSGVPTRIVGTLDRAFSNLVHDLGFQEYLPADYLGGCRQLCCSAFRPAP
jgi:tRNA pseudouridine65 synthase